LLTAAVRAGLPGSAEALAGRHHRAVTRGRFAGELAQMTGAGSGIGAAAARRLAAEGAAVVLAGRRSQPLDAVAAAVTEAGGRAAVHTADITVESDVRELIDFCLTSYGRLDVAFNNAGTTAASGRTYQLELAPGRPNRQLDPAAEPRPGRTERPTPNIRPSARSSDERPLGARRRADHPLDVMSVASRAEVWVPCLSPVCRCRGR
jgi:NAD(P)-dependent dehydrogenase (short-subunit alcohol dehydrogenase family)